MIKRAAVYARMSTEHQDFSIENQLEAIARYAAEHKLNIVKQFVDSGKSGLTLAGRPALRQLLLEVLSTKAEFEHILVYDVSRWGRFQDADESAYYEYLCKKENIRLHYCVEQFMNDGSPYSALLKALKRTMAAEYSRELSTKVSAAHTRLAKLGFHQGGCAGYGITRQLVDREGRAKGALKPGDHKGFQSDRVLLSVGSASETDVVRQIFKWFVVDGLYETHIARLLKQHDAHPDYFAKWGKCPDWTNLRVHQVLTNPKYIGAIVYNRTSGKLRGKRTRNEATEWACRHEAFGAIVQPEVYAQAQ